MSENKYFIYYMKSANFYLKRNIIFVFSMILLIIIFFILLVNSYKIDESEELKVGVDLDPYLSVPMPVVSHSLAPKEYRAQRAGMVIQYLGNKFNTDMPDNFYTAPIHPLGGPAVLNTIKKPLEPNEKLEILDNNIHDLMVGLSFIKVKRLKNNDIGFITFDTLTSETLAIEHLYDGYGFAVEGAYVWGYGRTRQHQKEEILEYIQSGEFVLAFPDREKKHVNPTSASADMSTLTLGLLLLEMPQEEKESTLKTVEKFFDEWVLEEAIAFPNRSMTWPYKFEFRVHWNMKLRPPWYSAFSSGQFAFAAANLYKITGKKLYKDIAYKSIKWLKLPIEENGPTYKMGPFKRLAEYVYNSPPKPNIRVLDGEIKAVLGYYNTAVILRDDKLLREALEYAVGLAVEMKNFTTNDCRILNARYAWLLDNESYVQFMKYGAISLGQILKDKTMFDLADCWKVSNSVW